MRRRAGFFSGGDEKQMDGFFNNLASGNVDKCSILEKGSIERSKCIVLTDRVASEMLFKRRRLRVQRCGETADFDARFLRRQRGKVGDVMAIDEYQTRAGQRPESKTLNRFACETVARSLENRLKRQFSDRRDIRETPVFVIDRGEPKLSKTGDPGFAERKHPRWLLRFVFETGKFLQIRFSFFHFGFGRLGLISAKLSQTVFHGSRPDAS